MTLLYCIVNEWIVLSENRLFLMVSLLAYAIVLVSRNKIKSDLYNLIILLLIMQVERKYQIKSANENCVIIEHTDGYNSESDGLSQKRTHNIMEEGVCF